MERSLCGNLITGVTWGLRRRTQKLGVWRNEGCELTGCTPRESPPHPPTTVLWLGDSPSAPAPGPFPLLLAVPHLQL